MENMDASEADQVCNSDSICCGCPKRILYDTGVRCSTADSDNIAQVQDPITEIAPP
ncbi:hypothetical protein J6590_029276 [Homalodisca vitripennis]|nr:hypothetical protein J6590_029273 [Homalodisca vitripennis]KAG8253703.1 hypothetical protein J6590_029276 [Homalodisca vitripennis]